MVNFIKSLNINGFLPSEEKLVKTGLIIACILLLIIAFSKIAYPYDTGVYEGVVWAPASLISHGINPYNLSFTVNPPYVMSPYGIFYYVLIAMGLKIVGFQFWVGRLLSLLCAILSTLCISKLTFHFTGDKGLARLSALLFLAQIPIQLWIGIQRPDMVALALSLAGITIALTWDQRTGNSKRLVSALLPALLLVLAILTRQTAILPVMVVAWWYFCSHSYRQLFLFLALTTTLLSITLFWLTYTSGGGCIIQQFILQSNGEKDIHSSLEVLFSFINSTLLCIILLWVIALCVKKSVNPAKVKSVFENKSTLYRNTMLLYGILSLILTFVASTHAGSAINYYLEVAAVISLIVPSYWFRVEKIARQTNYYRLCLLGIIISSSFMGIRICRGEYYRWKALPYYNEIVSDIKLKTPVNQPVYSEYPELAVFAGRTYYFNDFCQYDGRAPEQHQVYVNTLHSGMLSAMVTTDTNTPQGYYRYPISAPKPYKFYTVYLYLKK